MNFSSECTTSLLGHLHYLAWEQFGACQVKYLKIDSMNSPCLEHHFIDAATCWENKTQPRHPGLSTQRSTLGFEPSSPFLRLYSVAGKGAEKPTTLLPVFVLKGHRFTSAWLKLCCPIKPCLSPYPIPCLWCTQDLVGWDSLLLVGTPTRLVEQLVHLMPSSGSAWSRQRTTAPSPEENGTMFLGKKTPTTQKTKKTTQQKTLN